MFTVAIQILVEFFIIQIEGRKRRLKEGKEIWKRRRGVGHNDEHAGRAEPGGAVGIRGAPASISGHLEIIETRTA